MNYEWRMLKLHFLIPYPVPPRTWRGLHGDKSKELHHVVLEHITQYAGLLIIACAMPRTQIFSRNDIYVLDILSAPYWFEYGIGKTEHQDILHSLFDKVRINPEYLMFLIIVPSGLILLILLITFNADSAAGTLISRLLYKIFVLLRDLLNTNNRHKFIVIISKNFRA